MKHWDAEYSHGVTLVRNDDGTWYFDFPSADGVHYITRAYEGAPPKKMLLQMQIIKLAGGPAFISMDGDPPKVRLYFTNGDLFSNDGRWWSNPAYADLSAGRQGLAVLVTPGLWSNLKGTPGNQRADQFFQCAKNVKRVGFTFGGKFAGHGVYATGGKARCKFLHKVIAA